MMNRKSSTNNDEKVHPWRFCEKGRHFVSEHIEKIPPSKTHPEGSTTIVHEHCAINPSHKDELGSYEIAYISLKYFSDLSGSPSPNILNEFQNADKYDQEIRGWVRYWNDVFQPNERLDPNLIKALIATESSFNPDPPGNKTAHGLMQLTSLTLHVLNDTKGELQDYLIRSTGNESVNPSLNICAGIRWLFRKKETATKRLGHEATWYEAVIEYKDYWKEVNNGNDPLPLQHLRAYLKRLNGASWESSSSLL